MSGMDQATVWTLARRRRPVVLVTHVGGAVGARAAAAALACAASESDRAALLIDLDDGRPPRASLVATAGARELEERVVVHMPDTAVASRGQICHLRLPPDPTGIDRLPAVLPLARESVAVVLLPPPLLRPLLGKPGIQATAALLRADLSQDRALTALVTRDLTARGMRVVVLKRPLGWLAARLALCGVLAGGDAFPTRTRERLLDADDSKLRRCYDGKGEENDQTKGRAPR